MLGNNSNNRKQPITINPRHAPAYVIGNTPPIVGWYSHITSTRITTSYNILNYFTYKIQIYIYIISFSPPVFNYNNNYEKIRMRKIITSLQQVPPVSHLRVIQCRLCGSTPRGHAIIIFVIHHMIRTILLTKLDKASFY